ncbi:T9SS type A sorting domain-containing protein [Emticicia sp. SJ17W-69]|uniref:T9SS type A sorting domain-containing protein n=1 Tax=Emticicia sp. SJ17W-69 TaxID=3421657 RepID=UPI003EB99A23
MMFNRNWIVLLLCIISIETYSQIQITFPVSRIVFQRNNQNQANVNIAGSYFQILDRIDARAVPVYAGQGSGTDWITIQNSLTSGIFNGSLLLNGGWYNIELRGILNGNVVTTTTLDRVGVGEVFIVAGQSNAQGDPSYSGGAIGASDDRVSTIDYYEPALNEDALPFQFSHMSNFTKMSPYNYVPWFWSRLGDKLAQRLNVPVLFYGAALGGIGSDVWRRSVEGEDLRQELQTFIKVSGMPYRALKAAIQRYVTRTGVRAILWQHGESDSNTGAESYYGNLRSIIDKSRQDAKKGDLAWVIARASRNPVTYQNVIDGQNFTIQRISNVFTGPATDDIVGTNLRADGIHFHNDGLIRAAEYWNTSLNDSFFNNSQPLLGKELPKVYLTCDVNNKSNKFAITADAGFARYNWSNGSTSSTLFANNGSYSLKVQDDVGNMYFSQPIFISPNNPLVQPNINIGGPTTFCEGGTVQLTSSLIGGNIWSNGERGQSITARNSGAYTVTNYTLNGCMTTSAPVSLNVMSAPKNSIIPSKSIPICPDDSVTLVTNNFDKVSYLWNNNSSDTRITVKNAGSYSLKIKGENGCESQSSINVTLRQRPVTNINTDGPTTFCLGKSVNLSSSDDFAAYFWSNTNYTKAINVRSSGSYSLKVQDYFGCLSDPVTTNVVVNPLPDNKIVAIGLDRFCEGNTVKLQPSSVDNLIYQWNTGEKTKEIITGKPGLYTLVVKDNNNCESKPDSITLKYIPPPAVSIITAGNLNTICQGSSITLNSTNAVSYTWSTGSNSNNILVDKAGVYTLKIRDDKNCESNTVSFEVFVKESPQKPSIFIGGAYELEAIPTSFINGQFFEWKLDDTNLTSNSSIIKATSTGSYTVRTVLKHSISNNGTLLCYSPYSTNVNFTISEGDNGMKLYPNPNPTGIFYIETINENPDAKIYVYTLSGKRVLSLTMSDIKEKRVLDLRSLESGNYIIRLISNEFTASQKIIVKY